MDIRDKLITGSFMIGEDGRKEPSNWKDYALKLEAELATLQSSIPGLLKEQRETCAERADINSEKDAYDPYWYWPQCDVEGCEGVSCNNGNHWGKEYWCLCAEHSKDKREGKPQPIMKQSAIDRENSRDENGCLPISDQNDHRGVATKPDQGTEPPTS